MDNTAQAVAELLTLVLGQPVSPEDRLTMAATPAWDSMKHIELIITAEERFGISFEAEEIPLLTSQERLTGRIAELAHDRPD